MAEEKQIIPLEPYIPMKPIDTYHDTIKLMEVLR